MNTRQKELFSMLTAFQRKVATGLLSGKKPINAYRDAGGKAVTRKGAIDKISKMRKLTNFSAFMDLMSVEILSEAVMTRTEVLEKLSDIAMNSTSDQASISAIRRLCEMQGWYAPSKTMEVPAPPGIAERYSQEDYEQAQQQLNERFGSQQITSITKTH